MSTPSDFTIYNASAGSGKTYTLVKSYLKLVLGTKSQDLFKRILAITFTNKAVAEMKGRIIDTLKVFSDESILKTSDNEMFNDLCQTLDLSEKALYQKSKTVLDTIIHNYAAFDISTIDGFTHRIIRTFAYDLKLPLNFEVELDQDVLLNEAVDSLINKAGTDVQLTNILVDFAIEKADDDKSWDVALDFNKIAKLLLSENDLPYIKKLEDKTLEDFRVLKQVLKVKVSEAEIIIKKNAESTLDLIEQAGLEHSDFLRGTLPNHFKKVVKLDFYRLYDNKLEENISERKSIYNKTLDPVLASTIDQILPEIELFYKTIKANVFHLKFLKAFYKNITPLSVLNVIHKELALIKEDQNKMLISEFNSIISEEIKDQPTPFIYERIGEKFKHYFIDEFQDTSIKQWENLMPLINNALSAESGSTMLVGDAKQAIYRWRGGKAEQFIDLFNKTVQPFYIEQKVNCLDTNYRSSQKIIEFNNSLFSFISKTVFQNLDYVNLYEKAHQNTHIENDGYVELSFLDIEKDDDRNDKYCNALLNTINTCIFKGFQFSDITILVRYKKEGIAVANYLSENNIPILSSETLLIVNSQEVNFINNILKLLSQPENNEVKIEVLIYLAKLLKIVDEHKFFSTYINLSVTMLFESLEQYHIYINYNSLVQLPLYDLAESIARCFNLTIAPNAYIQYYLDIVLDFYQKKGSDMAAFLEYFDKKKETLTIISSEGQNAVQIMTIHKSKGLEFPIVIFPFADLNLYQEIEPKEWFSLDDKQYNGFEYALLNFNNDFEYFGNQGVEIYKKHKAEQELDNINLLYVALTRAEEQLYIISKNDENLKEESKNKKYSGLLINFLKQKKLWDPSKTLYSYGNFKTVITKTEEQQIVHQQNTFISNPKENLNITIVTKSGMLWDTHQENAIEKGNLVHDIMANIKTNNDVEVAVNQFYISSEITEIQKKTLENIIKTIIEHPKLKKYYSLKYLVINERDIISSSGKILRPDRLVLDKENNTITIIDYKTGEEHHKHKNQLDKYEALIKDMGYLVAEKILVYVNDDILVKRF
ncbi:UvrD-helicase domain-containing protein [Hyunsoonleella pacifica]|uniref:DNA 3'-5' helicase n=1 Tax=Hyunsoonleella pacifica TaxID=1080224 RepID=A0A4Q9FPP7_9FLAO|nr:UvrD-helicase domain-containing protein [Hyunsoonleella pacifica]TBN14652.1 DNA helicase UvrD [Hyunsoonleella pacifica]GGD15575.1 ATP-dependent helicase [Hyunsoonleella pacifica]